MLCQHHLLQYSTTSTIPSHSTHTTTYTSYTTSSHTANSASSCITINWSHLKPEFAGKPDEDAEGYPLRMNNWMDTHAFH